MIRHKIIPFLLTLSGMLIQSCSNEIDLLAPYKETGVIYGLINPSDSVHYVRIQKAYLGEGNALVMAQSVDSIYYPDILQVTMDRIKNGSVLETINLSRFISSTDKDEGVFPSSPNILYKTNGERIYQDSEYRIHVSNTQTGYTMEAQTTIVDSVIVYKPSYYSAGPIQFASQSFPYYDVRFKPSTDAKIYNLTIRFKYQEEDLNNIVISKHIDWVFANTIISDQSLGSEIDMQIKGEDFYKFVASKISPNPNLVRYAGSLDFIFTTGSEFLANYVAINQATTSILTSILDYTNVEGGRGIFSSRFIQVSPNKSLDQASLDLLRTGPYTANLGFQ